MCSTHSFDEINDNVVKSECGELVTDSDPPVAYSAHTTGGDVRRGQTRLLVCRKQRQKLSIASARAKNRILSRFDGRPQDSGGDLSCPRAWISMNSLVLSPTFM